MFPRVSGQLRSALAVLLPLLDIVEARVTTPEVPSWCRARDWDAFLLGLSDAELAHCESHGVRVDPSVLRGAPATLVELAADIARVTELPAWRIEPRALPLGAERGVRSRKREQLAVLLGALDEAAAGAERIVDIGAGSGHLTRLITSVLGRESLGLDRDPARVAAARARVAIEPDGRVVTYELANIGTETLQLSPSDLVVGLHACGSLSDELVLASQRARCAALVVSCCYQKIQHAERTPLSKAGAGLTLSRSALGLANLSARAVGVESTLQENLEARRRRYALRRLLAARGQAVAAGAEMQGINRRQAQAPFHDLVARALSQRGLPAAAAPELALHERASHQEFGTMRRWALPRNLLSRLLEVAILLDRAAALEESGASVRLGSLFEPSVSPRNLALSAGFGASA